MVESQVVLTPRARKAERYATTLALIVTLGPLFYGFEGMVLNGAISAVGSEFRLVPSPRALQAPRASSAVSSAR